jgi:hypothetical protein
MKLPASLVKTWGDLQLNFDALAKKIDPYVEAASFQGAWPTSTAGIPFTVPKTGRALIDCDATAYTTSGLGLQLEVFVDGLSTGRSMVLSFNCPANLHQPLGPCKIAMTLTRGTHYIAFKQLNGTSDANDYGNIAVVQP